MNQPGMIDVPATAGLHAKKQLTNDRYACANSRAALPREANSLIDTPTMVNKVSHNAGIEQESCHSNNPSATEVMFCRE